MLQTIRDVRGQEPSIGVREPVVDGVTVGDRSVVLQRVDVVIGGTDTQRSLQQSGGDELERGRDDQFLRFSSDQQITFVRPSRDLDNSVLQRGLVQIGTRGRPINLVKQLVMLNAQVLEILQPVEIKNAVRAKWEMR